MSAGVFGAEGRLSLAALVRVFPGRVVSTWSLVLSETALFAMLPLLIGWSIDGLLVEDPAPFVLFVGALGVLLAVSVARRIIDTRAYGAIRVELGTEIAGRARDRPVSVTNARVDMGRELVDFLETTAPQTIAAIVQVIASAAILLSFHSTLAMAAVGAAAAIVIVYACAARAFFRINADLNGRIEGQVAALQSPNARRVTAHFMGLRRAEVRLSDAESLVYGVIFLILLAMLAFNLWFAATVGGDSPGRIFSIVAYSFEFVQASVALPAALQTLTRLKEITERINADVPLAELAMGRPGSAD